MKMVTGLVKMSPKQSNGTLKQRIKTTYGPIIVLAKTIPEVVVLGGTISWHTNIAKLLLIEGMLFLK
jgi:hypothetical protein